MNPRAIELLDLPKLPRYRENVIPLDSRRALTRGNPLSANSFISYLNPKRKIYTAIVEDETGEKNIGGIIQRAEENFARLAYLSSAETPLSLIEHLASHAGTWGARVVVAEVGESNPLFQSLRQSGFAVYSRQRVWNLSKIALSEKSPFIWRKQKDIDLWAIQTLQNKIIPPLLQQIENFENSSNGMICKSDELMAYIDITYGARGIFLRPLIHPNTENLREKLLDFLKKLANRHERHVYICIRSHQAWIEHTLEEIRAKPGERQAVMVKHLVTFSRERKTIPVKGEKAWANPAATIAVERKNKRVNPVSPPSSGLFNSIDLFKNAHFFHKNNW